MYVWDCDGDTSACTERQQFFATCASMTPDEIMDALQNKWPHKLDTLDDAVRAFVPNEPTEDFSKQYYWSVLRDLHALHAEEAAKAALPQPTFP